MGKIASFRIENAQDIATPIAIPTNKTGGARKYIKHVRLSFHLKKSIMTTETSLSSMSSSRLKRKSKENDKIQGKKRPKVASAAASVVEAEDDDDDDDVPLEDEAEENKYVPGIF